ncbi:Uncharacterized protein TXXE_18940 [Thermobacillus xylanilyticus]|uniref:Uncharacterized protein n=1 Tax=Thermobacillus xylanilyticus TaxID=76633 RepID=A0ABN7SA54_THEXY|nr:hypothetical protein [Thermobacillus xylanilyticus]CAG5092860.1 Uncharacterized protein TXXE_18940 [Thermobacillus xylanilyticus]
MPKIRIDILFPPGKTDNYTSIEMLMFPGRSREAKRRICELITKNLKSAWGLMNRTS